MRAQWSASIIRSGTEGIVLAGAAAPISIQSRLVLDTALLDASAPLIQLVNGGASALVVENDL